MSLPPLRTMPQHARCARSRSGAVCAPHTRHGPETEHPPPTLLISNNTTKTTSQTSPATSARSTSTSTRPKPRTQNAGGRENHNVVGAFPRGNTNKKPVRGCALQLTGRACTHGPGNADCGMHRIASTTRAGKLPSSLICSGYMYLYIACMIFNRLMSAMSIDGIWQNNLIYFEIRRNAASRFGIRIPYPCWLTAFSHSSPCTHWPATAGSFPVHVLTLVLYSYSQCLQSEQLVL